MSNLAMTRGVHYWEVTIDKYDGNADPAFGIAKYGVSTDNMLGMWPIYWADI